jgi:hypothetical protein
MSQLLGFGGAGIGKPRHAPLPIPRVCGCSRRKCRLRHYVSGEKLSPKPALYERKQHMQTAVAPLEAHNRWDEDEWKTEEDDQTDTRDCRGYLT